MENSANRLRTISLIIKTLAVACGASGIWLTLASGGSAVRMLSYYTLQSNMICVILFVVLIILDLSGHLKKGRFYYLIKPAFAMCITVTMLVYQFVLTPQISATVPGYRHWTWMSQSLHLFAPALVLADWVFCDEKGHLRAFDPFIWAVIPLCYPLYVLVYGLCGGTFDGLSGQPARVPYFFLDVDALGWGGVAVWVVIILVGFIALSYILYLIDRPGSRKKPALPADN